MNLGHMSLRCYWVPQGETASYLGIPFQGHWWKPRVLNLWLSLAMWRSQAEL